MVKPKGKQFTEIPLGISRQRHGLSSAKCFSQGRFKKRAHFVYFPKIREITAVYCSCRGAEAIFISTLRVWTIAPIFLVNWFNGLNIIRAEEETYRTMTHLNLSLCVFLLILAAHSTCFVLNKFVHENGVKDFTVEKVIKKNNCICTCSCVPKDVPVEPEAPQLPEFVHKRQSWKDFRIVKEIKKNKCSCSCACATASQSPTTVTTQQTQSTNNHSSTLTPKSTSPANTISTFTLVDELINTTFAEITPSTSGVTMRQPIKAETSSPVVPTHDFQLDERTPSTVEWSDKNKSTASSTKSLLQTTNTTATSDEYSTLTSTQSATTDFKEVPSTESSTTLVTTVTPSSTTTNELVSSTHPSSIRSTLSSTTSTTISLTSNAATISIPSTTITSSNSELASVFTILNTTIAPTTVETSTLNPVFKEKVANLLNRLKEKLQKLREVTATTQQVEEAAESDVNAENDAVKATTIEAPDTATTTSGFNIDSEMETTLAVLDTHRTSLTATQELANARRMLNGLKRKLEELKFQTSLDGGPTNLSKSQSNASLDKIERLLTSAEGQTNSKEKDFINNRKHSFVSSSTIFSTSTSQKAVTTNPTTIKSTATGGESTRNDVNISSPITLNGEITSSSTLPPNLALPKTFTKGTAFTTRSRLSSDNGSVFESKPTSTHLLTSTITKTEVSTIEPVKLTSTILHATEKSTIPSTKNIQFSPKAEVTRSPTIDFSKGFTTKDVSNSSIRTSPVSSSIRTSFVIPATASETTRSANTTVISMNVTTTLKTSPTSITASTTSSSSTSTSTTSTINHASSTVSALQNITKMKSNSALNTSSYTSSSNTSTASFINHSTLALSISTITTIPPTSSLKKSEIQSVSKGDTSNVTTSTDTPSTSSSKNNSFITASSPSIFARTTTSKSTSSVSSTSTSSITEKQSTTTALLTSTAITQSSLKTVASADKMLEEFRAQRERTTTTQSVKPSSMTNSKVLNTQKPSGNDQMDAEHAFVIDTEDENIEKGDETKALEEGGKTSGVPDKLRTASKTPFSVGPTSTIYKSIGTSIGIVSTPPTITTIKTTNNFELSDRLSDREMPFAFVTETVETDSTDYDGTTTVNGEISSSASELFEASTASPIVSVELTTPMRPLAHRPNEKWANEITGGDFTGGVIAVPNPLQPAMIITTTQKTALFGSIRNSEFEAQRKTKILLPPPPPPPQATKPSFNDVQQNVHEHKLQSSTDIFRETKQMRTPADQATGESFQQQQVEFSSTTSLTKTIITTTLSTLTGTTKKNDHLQLTENLRVAKQNLEERLKQARQLREELRQLEMLSAIRRESSANDAESMLELQQRRRHIEERLAQLAQKERWHRELIQRYQLRQRALEAATKFNAEKADNGPAASIVGDRVTTSNDTPDVDNHQVVTTTSGDLPTASSTDSSPPILRPIPTPASDNDENEDPSARVCQQVRRFVTTFRIRDPMLWVRNNCVFVKQYYPTASCSQIQQLFAECF